MFDPNAISLEELNTRQNNEEGASLVEYAILVALIALVVIGAVTTMGEAISGSFDNASNRIEGEIR